MRTILIHSDVKGVDKFSEILSAEITDFNIALNIENVEPNDIEVAIIWFHAPDYLAQLPNLKLLLICGSGIDHIINSPNLPHNIPTVRLVDPYLRNHVTDYVIEGVLNQFFPELCNQDHVMSEEKKPKIGIMGLGLVGETMAEKFLSMGFEVCGWVKSSRPRIINEVYIGKEELKDFAENCEVLVCQLPLTKETRGILNSDLFDLLPKGAYLINVGRGGHLMEADLLSAIESGKISGAYLDVFEIEPLPLEHPFHSISNIKVTPHIAGYVSPETQAPYAAQIIGCYYRNEKIEGIVDYQAHY